MASNVLFHAFNLGHRGGTNSLRDYAYYNQEILGNKSTIVYDNSHQKSEDDVIEFLSRQFEVIHIPNDENKERQLNKLAESYDLVYSQRSGYSESPRVYSAPFAIHGVFGNHTDDCDRFAYISKYLADLVQLNLQKPISYIPYIVDLPPPVSDLRASYEISKDQFVFGRIGGYQEFDIDFVHTAIKNILDKRNDIVFLLVNTKPFYEHKNIIYTDPFFNQQKKSDFINSCDAMIHARTMGETFGLAMMEFLYFNKPVLAWEKGNDLNHAQVLKEFDTLYNSNNIHKKIDDMVQTHKQYDFSKIMAEFTPEAVMRKFNGVFLNETE